MEIAANPVRNDYYDLWRFGANTDVEEVIGFWKIAGITFEHAANGSDFGRPMVCFAATTNFLVEKCRFQYSSGYGVYVGTPDVTISPRITFRDCVFMSNAYMAVLGSAHLDNCDVIYNNWRGWQMGHMDDVLGGQKAGSLTKVENCRYNSNYTFGLWFDVWTRNSWVSNSTFIGNKMAGLYSEITYGPLLIEDCVIRNNAEYGFVLTASSNVTVTRTTITSNKGAEVKMYTGTRDTGATAPSIAPHPLFNIDFTFTSNTVVGTNRLIQWIYPNTLASDAETNTAPLLGTRFHFASNTYYNPTNFLVFTTIADDTLTGIAVNMWDFGRIMGGGESNSCWLTLSSPDPSLPVNGLVAKWSFEEESGGAIEDTVGGHNGFMAAQNVRTNGRIGRGIWFTNSSGIRITNVANIKPAGDYTVSAWVRFNQLGDVDTGYNTKVVGYKGGFTVSSGDGGVGRGAEITYKAKTGGTYYVAYGASPNEANNYSWHHTLCLRSNNTIYFYFDGVLRATESVSGANTYDAADTNFFIGRYPDNQDSDFIGFIDEVMIYNRALTPSEVTNLYLYNGDIWPPEWTSGTPDISNHADTSFDVAIMLDELAEVSYVLVADGESAPSVSNVKAGTRADGSAPGAKGTTNVSASNLCYIAFTGLTEKTAYDVYLVAEDVEGNTQANTTKEDVTTFDLTAPSFTSAVFVTSNETSVTVAITPDEDVTLYGVLVADGATFPSHTQVSNGTDGSDSAATRAIVTNITGDVETRLSFTSLPVNTSYDFHVFAVDPQTNAMASVTKMDVGTSPEHAPGWTSAPAITYSNGSSVTLSFTADEDVTVSYVVLTNGASAPQSNDVINGTDGNSAPPVTNGSTNAEGVVAYSLVITNLAEKTLYDVYIVAEDAYGIIQTAPYALATMTLDDTPPTWTTAYPAITNVGEDVATLSLSAGEDVTASYVVLADGALPPSVSNIIAGNDGYGAPALISGSTNITEGVDASALITPLTRATAYDVYVVAVDSYGNAQASATKLDFTTTDETAPVIADDFPYVTNLTYTSATFPFVIDEAATLYYVVLQSNATAPTATNVMDGVDGNELSALFTGTNALAASGTNMVVIDGLNTNTYYDAYFVARDAFGNLMTNVAYVPFTTEEYIPPHHAITTNAPTVFNLNNAQRFHFDVATESTRKKDIVITIHNTAGIAILPPFEAETRADTVVVEIAEHLRAGVYIYTVTIKQGTKTTLKQGVFVLYR